MDVSLPFLRLLALPVLACIAGLVPGAPAAAQDTPWPEAAVRQLAEDYLKERGEAEHLSCVSVAVSLPGQPTRTLAVGRVSREPGAPPATPSNLFQIGSITKSFTAAALLQLQAEGKLDLDQTLATWLPEYPAWKDVSLRRLLTMTSGIPTYDASPDFMQAEAIGPQGRAFSGPVLVGFVDPTYRGTLLPTTGWNYSNTNYVLAGMVVERASGRPFAEEIGRRFLAPGKGLDDVFYADGVYPLPLRQRTVSGYFWTRDPELKAMAGLIGQDMRDQDMSFAGPAGAMVATPEAVTRWVRQLYQGPVLADAQRRQLLSIVSDKTGQPIAATSAEDPLGFGLGVGQVSAPTVGIGWYYQGGSMGYRVMYLYTPKDDVVVTIGVNSNTDDAENKLGKLVADVHAAVTRPLP